MTQAVPFLFDIVSAYLVGSIPAGYLAGRLAGIDIRTAGSGNIGATNVVRILGKRVGYPVFCIDVGKGVLAVVGATFIAGYFKTIPSVELLKILAGIACVLGHSFPVWLNFKGGKGVATSIGVILALAPLAAVGVLIAWLVSFELSRYVSVASMISAVALPVMVRLLAPAVRRDDPLLFYFSLCLAVIVIVRHRANIARLIHGTETRFRRK